MKHTKREEREDEVSGEPTDDEGSDISGDDSYADSGDSLSDSGDSGDSGYD